MRAPRDARRVPRLGDVGAARVHLATHPRLSARRTQPRAVELTESTLLGSFDDASTALRKLRDLGVEVALDDFGTGYSSLAYLRRLPVDIVKVDRAFVQRLGHDAHADDRRIAAGIIDLAHDLGLTVVA